jgi:putative N6-adenine-specific DNA methylase
VSPGGEARSDLFASCLPGLEPLLLAELKLLGIADGKEEAGGVAFAGDMRSVYRVNLCSGIANHVLLRVARFPVRQLPQLRDKADAIDWSRFLEPGAVTNLKATCRRSKLYHSGAVAERVAAAIAAQLGSEPRPGSLEIPIQVRMFEDMCSISIDTSGDPLHRRGWRLAGAKAPLREDLAHALILASDWDRASPLLDPMMGSGTIPIEAAGLARGLPPGRGRAFAFESMGNFDAEAWAEVRADCEAKVRSELDFEIHGSDRDAGALRSATENAERAGVAADLRLKQAPLAEAEYLAEPEKAPASGAVVCNPPFGKRVGSNKNLLPLFQSLGQRLSRLPEGWCCAILANDRRLALRTGVELRTAFLSTHGGLKVRALVS